VHPLLADVERQVPRGAREEFSLFSWAGWIEAELVELPRAFAADPTTSERFEWHWSESNSRFEAAHSVAAYLEQDGVAPLNPGGVLYSDERIAAGHRNGFGPPVVTVHFEARRLQIALGHFSHGVPRVILVLNPSARKQPLRALDMRATADEEAFSDFRRPSGKALMRERLEAARLACELPEHLLGVGTRA
jgi:hypothetical protein